MSETSITQQDPAPENYGKRLLEQLSKSLTGEFGKGFSLANIRNFLQFHLTYKDIEIRYAMRSELSWTHHRLIMREESSEARNYYITQAKENNWSSRTLEHQLKLQDQLDQTPPN